MQNEDLLYTIALTKVENVGAVTAKTLISYCGNANAVFKEKISNLMRIPYIGGTIAKSIRDPGNLKKAEKEIEFVLKNKITVLTYLDENYPYRLKNYHDSPVLVYYQGNANLNQDKIISVVGTRRITEYGKNLVNSLIHEIKHLDILVLSGLAYGVDSAAHKACVEEHVYTVGVLGHGLDRIYPADNKKLSLQMLQYGGLLTEFGMDTKPDRENFPMRNRIVAGMSDAVIVVETLKEGGSMITAEYANNYHKDVFAFPGKTNDNFSSGCNYLIKNHKAQLIENAEDLILNMRWDIPGKPTKTIQQKLFLDLDADEQNIVNILQKDNLVHVDIFHQNLDLSPSKLASLLLNLEFNGVLKSLPGKRYSLIS
ncbi:MAG: DNA-processing protein DprA [Saprospiraceae bacterium]